MTTACVAVGTPQRWRGVLHPHDGHPTTFGPYLWRELTGRLGTGVSVEQVCTDLLQFDSWDAFTKGGFCSWCGRIASSSSLDENGIGKLLRLREVKRTAALPGNLSDALTWTAPSDAWRKLNLPDPAEKWALIDAEWEMRLNEAHRGRPDPDCRYHQHPPPPPDDRQITERTQPAPDWVYLLSAGTLTVFHPGNAITGEWWGLNSTEPDWNAIAEIISGATDNL